MELTNSESPLYKYLQQQSRSQIQGKCMTLNTYIRKEIWKIMSLAFKLQVEKDQQNKPK